MGRVAIMSASNIIDEVSGRTQKNTPPTTKIWKMVPRNQYTLLRAGGSESAITSAGGVVSTCGSFSDDDMTGRWGMSARNFYG